MRQFMKITEDMYWVGGNDRRLALFESAFPIPRGISYNAYLVLDKKTVLFDTVDKAVSGVFFENLASLLAGRALDYVVVNHMEPDHCATLGELVIRYPEAKIVTNSKAVAMIRQFFDFDVDSRVIIVKEGDTLSTGLHTFTFILAPMVHWPETMVSYDTTDKILYSADAFGTFGAIGGNIFADEVNFQEDWLPDARRYYTNIVGKYGPQVQSLLNKAAKLDIAMICPLHGPVWRQNIDWYIDKYRHWCTYTPEENAVMVAYSSVYGNTQNAAEILASRLGALGIRNVVVYDVSVTHPSVIVAEAFRCSHLVFASTTYNAGIFCNMEAVLLDIKAHGLKKRTVAFIENGSWAATAGGLMKNFFSSMAEINILADKVTVHSSVKEEQYGELMALADAIYSSMPKSELVNHTLKIEPTAMFNISYGLFVLTAKEGEKDNGCIINTAIQITDSPMRISIAVNKANYTHDMILRTGIFNVSILSTDTPYKVFEHFGFQSGRNINKFADCESEHRSENGLLYLPKYTNSFISGKVYETKDCGSHTVFIADVTEAAVLSSTPSITYQYYFDNVKPKAKPTGKAKTGYICKICGYVYEGDPLPADFICPLCKHGAEVFEKIV